MERLTVYLHGQPGSPAELTLFGGAAPADWWVPDRQRECAGAAAAQHLDRLARAVRQRAAGRPVRLAGFSLGGWLALELAARLPDLDLVIELISPAGPLGDGAVLARMAGGAVFGLARRAPWAFAGLAMVQGLIARLAPAVLVAALGGSAGGADRALWQQPGFRMAMADNLRAGMGQGTAVYRREIAAYVGDWAAGPGAIAHPVRVWHGAADSWSPPELVEALIATLPAGVERVLLPGAGHYATLAAWLGQQQP